MHLADESDVALDVLPDAQQGRDRRDQHEDAQALHRRAPGSLPRQEDRHDPSAAEREGNELHRILVMLGGKQLEDRPGEHDKRQPVQDGRQAGEALLIAHTLTTYALAIATNSGAIVVSNAARNDSIVSNGPSAASVCAISAFTPGSCCKVSTSTWLGATGTKRYFSNAAISSGETYLPIS